MSLGTSNSTTEFSSSSIFGIPLSHQCQMLFDDWGQTVETVAQASAIVGGIDQFIGDQSNRMLRCLIKAEQLAKTAFSVDGSDSLPDSQDDEPCHNVSPIVLYGETGTGKTSLALSLLSRICELSSSDTGTEQPKPFCFAGSEFYRRHLAAMDRQSLSEFRERILASAGLLIDNIGQLEGKDSAQRELVYLIDKITRMGKPLVVTMHCSPLETNRLHPQLLSRLVGGLSLPVLPPGLEARREIISRLSLLHRIILDPEAANWIADRMVVSVPRLNQFFIQLKTRLRSLPKINPQKPVDMMVLGLVFQQDETTIDSMASRIIDMVADEFDLTPTVLCSNSRKQTVVLARGVTVWLMRKMLGFSYHAIGKRMGNRDHTTILHAYQKYDALIKVESDEGDSSLSSQVRTLQHRLNDLFAGQMTLVP